MKLSQISVWSVAALMVEAAGSLKSFRAPSCRIRKTITGLPALTETLLMS